MDSRSKVPKVEKEFRVVTTTDSLLYDYFRSALWFCAALRLETTAIIPNDTKAIFRTTLAKSSNQLCFMRTTTTQQTRKIGPMLAISRQGWQSVGKFANALPMLPMFCQHLCKRRNYCSSKFPRIFSRLCNDSGPFSFTYSFPICQKYFFFITIQPTLVEYWLNIGCQHRHYAFQPIQGQCWMPAPGQHWWVKFFLTIDNFL